MRVHHKLRGREEDDFGLVNVDEVNRDVDQFTGAIAMVVTPITLISLVVGGIVVMNIMLVTVNERTFEIGLRKAIGARRREIMLQFLIESAMLCAIGGVLGLLLAAGLSGAIRAASGIPMVVTIGYVLLALVRLQPGRHPGRHLPGVAGGQARPRDRPEQELMAPRVTVETLRMAFDNLRSHRLRSALTIFGVVIGVLVVVVVASILTGLRQNVIQAVEEYGTNNIFAFHLTTGPQLGDRDRTEYRRKPLRAEDAAAIRDQAPAVEDVANCAFLWLQDRTIVHGREKYGRGSLQGVTANYLTVTNMGLREGRFLTEADDLHRRSVMVLGANVAEALYGPFGRPVGSQVDFAGRTFTVIGVLDKRKGGFMGENEDDNVVLLPFRTVRALAPHSSEWMLLIIRARSGQLPTALDQVEEILRRQRRVRANKPSDFDLSTADRIIQQFDGITAAIGLIAIAISSVSLLVGGIGVMNIMLVSVTERTQEIGVRKAIGARRGDIVRQFLFEAMALTLTGGVIGVLLAVAISHMLVVLLPDLPAQIPAWAVIAGLVVSISVGLGFGVWPAQRAAALDPVEALRYE